MTDADSYEGKTKIFRFAASRGFEPDLVAKVIRQMFSN
jgi:SOS response regulatory protein OraA/RecX